VREVVGTNFIGGDGDVVSQALVEEIVRSVRRMDQLAEGDILPGFEQLIRYSLFEFSAASGGPSRLCENEADFKKRIQLCKRVTRRDQVCIKAMPDGSSFLGFEDLEGDYFGEAIKESFVDHTEKAIAAWKKLIQVDETAGDEQIARDIVRQLQKFVIWQGHYLDVPESVLQAVLDKWNAGDENPDTTFTYAALVENWYYVEFARGRLTRRRKENDGHDLRIATYLSRAQYMVTADENLRRLLSHVTRKSEDRILYPAEFVESCCAE
jgi:hypothetical protein